MVKNGGDHEGGTVGVSHEPKRYSNLSEDYGEAASTADGVIALNSGVPDKVSSI
jgi:hypothetical protein